MPEYPFQSVTSQEVRHFVYSMADVPSIGEIVERDGGSWKRLPSAALASVREFQPFVNRQVERNHPLAPRLDEAGRPVFHSKREVQEFSAKTRDQGRFGHYHWD